MPHINPQPKALLVTTHIRQSPDGDHIIKPVVVLVASLEHSAKLQPTARLRGSRSLQENVGSVVGLEIVASICAEDACLWIGDAPVGADVEDFAYVWLLRARLQSWSFTVRLVPDSLGPVKLPPMIGMVVRMPRGPCDS